MMFGGVNNNGNYFSRITAYTPHTDEWTMEGNLLTPRYAAGVISVDNDSFLIIGGDMELNDEIRSEKCVYRDDQLVCSYQTPNQPQGE